MTTPEITPSNSFNRIDLSGVGFARLDEYFGLWAMESARFRMAWDRANQMDLVAHVEQTKPAKAQVNTQIVPVSDQQSSFGPTQQILIIKASGALMKQVPSGEHGSSTILLRRVLRMAMTDDTIAGIVMVIDSPGGTVSGNSDLAADIAMVNKVKPVWAYIEDLGASAAYWCACACDRIVANHRTAAVGSIGTILCLYDMSERAKKEGIEAVVIATGELKGAGFPGAAITDEHRAYFQRIINETQTSFAQAVQDGRGLSAEAVAKLATGEVWLADQAMELGLIDAIQSLDQTIDEMREHLHSDNTNTGGQTTAAHAKQEDIMPKTIQTRTRKNAAATSANATTDEEKDKKPVGKAAADENTTSGGKSKSEAPKDDDEQAKSQDAAGEGEDECECAGEEGCDCDKEDAPAEPAAEDDEDDKPKATAKPVAKASGGNASGGVTNARAAEGQKFINAFGDKGAVWYAQGKSFAEARDLHTESLAKENAELKARIEGMDLGAKEPLKLSGESEKPTADAKLAANIGTGAARFAGGIKLPKQK